MRINKDHSGEKIGVIIERLLFNVIFASIIVALIGFIIVQTAYRRYYSFNLVKNSVENTYKHISEAFVNTEKRDTPDLVDMIEKSLPDIEEDEIDDWLRRGLDINESTCSEFNIVDGRGIIIHSTNPDYIGYDMHSGEQSAEFLCLLSGTPFYSQDVQGTSFDENKKMHYYGMPFKNIEGFIQVGVSSELYDELMNEFVADIARNRNIGLDGFVIICDRTGNVIGSTNDLFEEEAFAYMDFLPENVGGLNKEKLEFLDQEYYAVALTEESFCIIGCYPVGEAGRAGLIDVLIFLVIDAMIAVFIFKALSRLLQREVIDGVESLNGSLAKITEGDLDEKADFRESLEFNELSDGINFTVDRLKTLIKEAEERIDTELSQAAKIQASFLPRVFPPFPDRKEFELFASMVPAKKCRRGFLRLFLCR
ncbi:MAG: methyl-accepting chemotaxis protein [Lachnospiraceae bacterium]|nr:methyl-accepting chemotaxis protein [Lachnospiraceae bacterium]